MNGKNTGIAGLTLASGSPYRAALLARLAVPFDTVVPSVDESSLPGESAGDLVRRLARSKARAAAARVGDRVIVGSDQAAVRDGTILGKPGDHTTAQAQLLASAGRSVAFVTGVCVLDRCGRIAGEHVDVTTVRFRRLSENEIDGYLRLEQPYDCAGSFKAEALGIALFDSIESKDPTALTGLPLIWLSGMLRRLGLSAF